MIRPSPWIGSTSFFGEVASAASAAADNLSAAGRAAHWLRLVRLFSFCGLCWAGWLSTAANGQLTILSQGKPQLKWRESQISTLQAQLTEASAESELHQELTAQIKWLEAWQPGKLTEQPLWQGASVAELWQEPNIDPSRKARALRQKLLDKNAQPTVADTRQLQELLQKLPNDVGVRQLHLHWLDQSQYRKQYPAEIAESAAKVLALLEGLSQPDASTKLARIFCLYRRGRALAYRELPDVLAEQPLTAEELEQNEAELVGVYRQLKELVSQDRPEFVLLDVRMLRRDKWYGRALKLLEDFGSQLSSEWYLKKRRDVLRDLGWKLPAEEAASIYATAFPEKVAAEVPGEADKL